MADSSLWETCKRSVAQQTFYAAFRGTFELIEADNEPLRRQAYRLRYQVFCEENNINLHHQNEMEYDAYDAFSAHYLLIHKPTGNIAGTVRVVFPEADRPLFSFPLQAICDHPFLHSDERALQLCEISRLCMAREFRQRPDDGTVLPAYHEPEPASKSSVFALPGMRRRIPYAPLGLFHGAFKAALNSGTLNCIAMMDPMQFRSLKQLGMDYRVLGPRLDAFGRHQPLVMNIKTVLDSMAEQNRFCWEVVSDRGKLERRATELSRFEWHDTIFDQATRESVMDKLL